MEYYFLGSKRPTGTDVYSRQVTRAERLWRLHFCTLRSDKVIDIGFRMPGRNRSPVSDSAQGFGP